jgi:hypothetical protein
MKSRFFKKNKVLLFPFILFILLIALTSLRLSGTSIGIYHEYLYGETSKDPDLLFGKPQSVRSDEWLVNTQLTIAQSQNDFQRLNENFIHDKDMSLLGDAPYLDWSAVFKPQNLAFFLLPLEYAFAFKWWFLLFGLMLSVYFFSLKLLPGKVLLAIAAALVLGFSPFVAWWYLTGTIATLGYGFLIALVSMSIIDQKRLTLFKKTYSHNASLAAKVIILFYLLSSFGLLLYPPFQIPIALVVTFFVLGYMLNTSHNHSIKNTLNLLFPFIITVVMAGGVLGAFLYERSAVFNTINNTAYPGKRIATSGGEDIKKLLTTYLQPQLQRENRGENYGTNQSESSAFILMPLYFILPAIGLLIWLYIKKRRVEWTLLGLLAISVIFLAQLFVPHIDILSKVFFLHLVPHYRLGVGLGFLAIMLVLYMVHLYIKYQLSFNRRAVISIVIYSLIFFVLMLWAGIETSKIYPTFISSKKLIVLLSGILMLGNILILLNRPRVGLWIVALFSFFSVLWVNPVYRGLGPLADSDVIKTIQTIAPPQATWAAAQDIFIENLPQISGRTAVTGVSTYPESEFWKTYSSEGSSFVYNRYAHMVLSSNNDSSLVLAAPDLVTISANCQRKIAEKIEYVVSVTPLSGGCYDLRRVISYPNIKFYIYKQ